MKDDKQPLLDDAQGCSISPFAPPRQSTSSDSYVSPSVVNTATRRGLSSGMGACSSNTESL